MKQVPVERAVAVVREGGVALVPTDTVVGLAAAGSGLPRLSAMKHRDPDKPIALLCHAPEDAFARARGVPSLARTLSRRYWPGPLTLVLDAIGGGTVGVRVPAASAVRDLLAAHGEPLHATSANLSGEPAPRALEAVDGRIREAVDVVLSGEAGSGEASAVVDLSGGNVRLLRAAEYLTDVHLKRLADHESSSSKDAEG